MINILGLLQSGLYFIISFSACVVGAICGIGGGIIIKPVLDLIGLDSVSTISFLSGCTVLSMSLYCVAKCLASSKETFDYSIVAPLAIGGSIGGVLGKQMFSVIKDLFASPGAVGSIQSVCLAAITVATLFYTLKKDRIRTFHIVNTAACLMIGFFLGVLSSFLGIGGGPINLFVLCFFFSMDTKTAARCSLFIILCSQITSLITTVATNSVPAFEAITLILMVCGGVGGGIAGRKINQKIDNETVDKLFVYLMVLIVFISLYNAVKYANLI